MNEWKYQLKRRKREDRCLINYVDSEGKYHSRLCGCGYHAPPSKRKKVRIVKRILARQLWKELHGDK